MIRCVFCARAAGATPSPLIHKPRPGYAYLDAAGHGTEIEGLMFHPLKHNGKGREGHRPMDPDAIDRVVRKYAGALGLDRGYSAHSMRATFITTALENGAQLEDVQEAAGHRDPITTKLYDRRGYNPQSELPRNVLAPRPKITRRT
jgi:integrase